jgi:site-specific DNA recombinase
LSGLLGSNHTIEFASIAKVRGSAPVFHDAITTERAGLVRTVRDEYALVSQIAGTAVDRDTRLAESQDRIRDAERRVTEIDDELASLQEGVVDEIEVAGALGEFDQLWEVLSPKERARVVELIVERVTYDGTEGKLAITYRPTGLWTLANEIVVRTVEAA